ncbi:hypothetical protein C9374_003815 [Naegleria lovaniensis]|uniref:Uncharacterized protein n=1 Tax=Naegleria lovaniensis TaxID=51637 RepID=A0AA88H5K0_NAELO|nr:uncharacterized protein C9374_003815 [Naegleria lovaniensis]KAG2394051.1 hypothetical protein C9374_003815 [Naegleria lovaniensis]
MFLKRVLAHATSVAVGVWIGSQYIRGTTHDPSRMKHLLQDNSRPSHILIGPVNTQPEINSHVQQQPSSPQQNESSKREVSLTEKIYHYLEEQRDDHRWPKFNIHVEEPTKEQDQTFELFKTFNEFGLPTHVGRLNVFSRFLSVTDSNLKIPLYVCWSIPRFEENYVEKSDRKFSKFMKSPIFEQLSSFNPDNTDYFGSNYSRGHLVNCGDLTRFDQVAMNETHLLANNIVPQDFDNNANYWLRMERFTRSLADRFHAVHVIAGPVFMPTLYEQQNKIEPDATGKPPKGPKGEVKHLIIGNNHVAVPTHLFRIIIAEKRQTETANEQDAVSPQYYAQAFIVPNRPIDKLDHLTKYSVSLKEVEYLTGMRFLDKLEKSGNMNPLCCNTLDIDANLIDQEVSHPEKSSSEKTKCACSCDLPPWQDIEFQTLLWNKNITERELTEKWDSLLSETSWKPSKDIIRRRDSKLEELRKK